MSGLLVKDWRSGVGTTSGGLVSGLLVEVWCQDY